MSATRSADKVATVALPSNSREASEGGKSHDVGSVSPRNTLNELTSKEWIAETVSVWSQRGLGRGHRETEIERLHPAPFSYQDISRLIRFFTKSGHTVLDPFGGVGSTLKAAALEGRRGIAVELNPEYVRLTRERMAREVPEPALEKVPYEVHAGDARNVRKIMSGREADLIVTSPPYWNILHRKDHKARQEREAHGLPTRYGDDDADLGNVENYGDFLDELEKVFHGCFDVLRERGHICVVVGDFRRGGRYYMFHADVMGLLEMAGFMPTGLQILHQRQKRVFPYGYPTAFVPNIHHQYVVIARKAPA